MGVFMNFYEAQHCISWNFSIENYLKSFKLGCDSKALPTDNDTGGIVIAIVLLLLQERLRLSDSSSAKF